MFVKRPWSFSKRQLSSQGVFLRLNDRGRTRERIHDSSTGHIAAGMQKAWAAKHRTRGHPWLGKGRPTYQPTSTI
eukprot:9466627-Pyramimonas_sp.AAC.1